MWVISEAWVIMWVISEAWIFMWVISEHESSCESFQKHESSCESFHMKTHVKRPTWRSSCESFQSMSLHVSHFRAWVIMWVISEAWVFMWVISETWVFMWVISEAWLCVCRGTTHTSRYDLGGHHTVAHCRAASTVAYCRVASVVICELFRYLFIFNLQSSIPTYIYMHWKQNKLESRFCFRKAGERNHYHMPQPLTYAST